MIFLALLVLISPFAYAGNEHGNGGDVVYCDGTPPAGAKKIELLDYYESRLLRKKAPCFEGAQADYTQLVTYVLNDLARIAPVEANKYLDHAKTFIDEAEFVNDELEDIPDSQHLMLPSGCRIRQIVIQRHEPLNGAKRYIINARLWNELDNTGRAGVVLHEVIYRQAIAEGHQNSQKARIFNSVISSGELNPTDLPTYFKWLSELGLPDFGYRFDERTVFHLRGPRIDRTTEGLCGDAAGVDLDGRFMPLDGTFCGYTKDFYEGPAFVLSSKIPFDWDFGWWKPRQINDLSFFPPPTSRFLKPEFRISVSSLNGTEYVRDGETLLIHSADLFKKKEDSSFKLRQVHLARSAEFKTAYSDIMCNTWETISFFDNGNITGCHPEPKGPSQVVIGGQWVPMKSGEELSLYENGRVKEWSRSFDGKNIVRLANHDWVFYAVKQDEQGHVTDLTLDSDYPVFAGSRKFELESGSWGDYPKAVFYADGNVAAITHVRPIEVTLAKKKYRIEGGIQFWPNGNIKFAFADKKWIYPNETETEVREEKYPK